MSPLNFNFPFRKSNGELTTLGRMFENSGGGGSYTLPTASASTKGGIKIGSGLTMDGETLNNNNPTPYDDSEITGAIAQINSKMMSCELNGYVGAKNLLRYPYNDTTKTINGITYTDNGDGTITASGTATGGNAIFNINGASTTENMLKPNTTYKFSTGDFEGSTSTIWVRTWILDNANSIIHTLNLVGGEIEYTTPNDIKGINMQIVILEGQTASNLTFKPMIRFGLDSDSTWQPYAKTNKELTDALASLQNAVNALNGG